MKAYKTVIKHAIATGCTVSVWDGEAWQVKRSTSFSVVVGAVESVDIAELRIRDLAGAIVGWFQVSDGDGFEDDETVIDYTITPFATSWAAAYTTT